MEIRVLALVTATLLPQFAAADQNDPRLDRLFAVIQTTEQTRQARAAEQAIWAIWFENDRPELADIMARGVDAMRENRLTDALSDFSQLVAVAPDFAEAWNRRATVHYLLGNLDESISDVEETLALEPRHFGALSGLGQIQMLKEDEAAALVAFEQALEMNPHLANTKGIIKGAEAQRNRTLDRDVCVRFAAQAHKA